MRAGSKRIMWRVEDQKYLLENAGRIPKREICRHLKRSGKAVERMAARLRKQGYAIDLRHYQPSSTICIECGRHTVTADKEGVCRPCQLSRNLRKIESDISVLLAKLPARERSIYEDTEAERGTRKFDPMPKRPTYTEPPSLYQQLKDEDAYEQAMEAWVAMRLHRKCRAAQKRKERIVHKLAELK